jgi:hypothetical protein
MRGIDFDTFCEFSIEFWNCSDSVVFFVIYFIRLFVVFDWLGLVYGV